MIPSTTKLVLLYTILQALPEVLTLPKRHYQSQEGDFNLRADIKDVGIVLLPSKEIIDFGINLVVGKGAGGRQTGSLSSIGGDRIKSKYGFVRPEKSPYKVDLEKSTVPLMKVDNTPEIKAPMKEGLTDEDNKTVKKDLKPTDKKEVPEKGDEMKESEVKKEEEKKKVESLKNDEKQPENSENKEKMEVTTRQKGMKMQGGGETLILIHEGIEDCGPDGHRNEEGLCIFSPLT